MVRIARFRFLQPGMLGLLIFLSGNAPAQTPAAESKTAEAAVRSFHEALRRGDGKTVEELLAADAVILENGHSESRPEYLSGHLKADIEFAMAVSSEILTFETTVAGDSAWVRSTSKSQGRFRDRDVKLSGAELMVLTRGPSGWQIRAIHWSSHSAR